MFRASASQLASLSLGVASLLVPDHAFAFVPLDGYFIASQACEVFVSKKKKTNPGNVRVEPSRAYELLGRNKEHGEFYQIRMPDAPVADMRWVATSCGIHVVEPDTTVVNEPLDEPLEPIVVGNESSDNLLALSWQPAFCELKPNKAECRELNDGERPIAETQLSIHGLWAQPRGKVYCNVSAAMRQLDVRKQWAKLPELALSAGTRGKLRVLMPGTSSFLQRHEWIKHGTCHMGEGGAEEYYADTIAITDNINQSAVGQFLAKNVGENVSTQTIRDQFNSAFGKGTGDRVQFHCEGDGNRVLLLGLKINLKGLIDERAELNTLLLAASKTSLGCPEGIIDPAGLQ
ncbi:MAG: ribonuclease T(2) [Granulosicoccus sp.]